MLLKLIFVTSLFLVGVSCLPVDWNASNTWNEIQGNNVEMTCYWKYYCYIAVPEAGAMQCKIWYPYKVCQQLEKKDGLESLDLQNKEETTTMESIIRKIIQSTNNCPPGQKVAVSGECRPMFF